MDDALFGSMVDAVGVGVAAYDESGRYLYVNEAYGELLDADPESLIGTPIWEINRAIDSDQFESYWNSYSEGETRKAEAIHQYDDTAVEVQTITTRVRAAGTPYHVGTIQDISLRKRRERQLNQLHTVTKELIEADSRSEIAAIISETAETILGYERNVVRLRSELDRLEPVVVSDTAREDIDESWAYDLDTDSQATRAYEDQEPVVVDDTVTLEDGRDRGAARSVMYIPIGFYGILSVARPDPGGFGETDVDLASILASNAETALRRLEYERDLEHKNERLEAFVDVISHDIPNHLNVAETRVDLARQQEDFSQLDHVSNAHERIDSIISDMRMLVDYGEQIDSMDWIRLPDLVDECWDTCREAASEATLELPDEGYLRADESRLKQLFENLLWNALDHAGPEPTVRVGLLDDGFYVEDDGPGIPEGLHQEVLAPGFTESDDDAHSGFGLAIVDEIARAHGWEMAVTDSQLGESSGARFEITGVTIRTDDGEQSQ